MKTRRKKIKSIILGILTALAALAMALLPVLLRASRTGGQYDAAILDTQVKRSSIRATISGGGALTGADARKISLPQGVEITRYLVKNGQSVAQGEPLVELDRTTVMQTIAVVQKNLEYLDGQMGTAAPAQTSGTLFSPVSGRVMAVYAENGSRVTDVMLSHGALAVVSLDGRMAVELETEETVSVGETVTVTLSDGRDFPGRVERRQENTLTVTLTDDGPVPGDTAQVKSADGRELGEGELRIHSAWNLTAVSGVVKRVNIQPGQKIQRGAGLCVLEEMDGNGRFDQLAAQRRDYEETLSLLFSLYESGAILAPEEGVVDGVDTAALSLTLAGEEEFSLRLLSETGGAPDPGPDDPNHRTPADFQSKAAVVSAVSYGSVSFLANGSYSTVSSYASPTEPDYAQAQTLTLTAGDFAGAQVYVFSQDSGQWTAASPSVLEMGQLVYLVYDDSDNLHWVLVPAPPEEQEVAVFPGGGGAAAPFEMYDLTRREIMRLIPRGDMTVQVKIDEMDILQVTPGQEAEITMDALPGRSFVGLVREIDPNGVNSGGRTRYTVTISVEPEEDILAGMNATAILTVGVTEDILTLPVAALVEKGSRTLVYTGYDPQSGELLAPVEVETGVSDGVSVEIVSGLAEGQQVFYPYYETESMPELSAVPGQLA